MPEQQTSKTIGPYLKNAWAKKDAEGDYWLLIQSSKGQAMFCLSECIDLDVEENATIRRALDAWLAEQDAVDRDSNGNFTGL